MKVERLDKKEAEKVLTLGDLPNGTVFTFLEGSILHEPYLSLENKGFCSLADDGILWQSSEWVYNAHRAVRILNVKLVVLP